jgi:hypothetical protein
MGLSRISPHPDIFNPWLVEYVDAKPVDMEGLIENGSLCDSPRCFTAWNYLDFVWNWLGCTPLYCGMGPSSAFSDVCAKRFTSM